jgi:hypothetical protein
MRTRRSIDDIIGLEPRNKTSTGRTRKKRTKVPCYCNNCNGKLVLKRTKLLHESNQSKSSTTDPLDEMQQDPIDPLDEIQAPIGPTDEMQQDPINTESEGEHSAAKDQNRHVDLEYTILPRKRTKRHINRPQVTPELPDRGSESSIDETSGAETNDEAIAEVFEDYSPPLYQDPDMEEEVAIDEQFSWILLWIMNFRIRFNIPETATESLIKFMKLVLNQIGGEDFSKFLNSLYLARKILGLNDQFRILVPCPKCHKLYQKQEVKNFRQDGTLTIMNCRHVEFSNSAHRKLRTCNTPLSHQIGITIQPDLEFPFSSIRKQLATMFRRPNFEDSLCHWTNRQQSDDILSDIYDGVNVVSHVN